MKMISGGANMQAEHNMCCPLIMILQTTFFFSDIDRGVGYIMSQTHPELIKNYYPAIFQKLADQTLQS
jgi:hypothetical protein